MLILLPGRLGQSSPLGSQTSETWTSGCNVAVTDRLCDKNAGPISHMSKLADRATPAWSRHEP